MEMYIILGVFLIWLSVITYAVFKIHKHYANLTSHTNKKKLDEALDEVLSHDKLQEIHIENMQKSIEEIKDEVQHHLRTIGIKYFNPFGKTTSENSFILALLDNKKTGLLLNFIYTHDGLRIYPKKIKDGKGDEYVLSADEEEVIKK